MIKSINTTKLGEIDWQHPNLKAVIDKLKINHYLYL